MKKYQFRLMAFVPSLKARPITIETRTGKTRPAWALDIPISSINLLTGRVDMGREHTHIVLCGARDVMPSVISELSIVSVATLNALRARMESEGDNEAVAAIDAAIAAHPAYAAEVDRRRQAQEARNRERNGGWEPSAAERYRYQTGQES
jgi:hypothetical protein